MCCAGMDPKKYTHFRKNRFYKSVMHAAVQYPDLAMMMWEGGRSAAEADGIDSLIPGSKQVMHAICYMHRETLSYLSMQDSMGSAMMMWEGERSVMEVDSSLLPGSKQVTHAALTSVSKPLMSFRVALLVACRSIESCCRLCRDNLHESRACRCQASVR
jgi:hypothetical protein